VVALRKACSSSEEESILISRVRVVVSAWVAAVAEVRVVRREVVVGILVRRVVRWRVKVEGGGGGGWR